MLIHAAVELQACCAAFCASKSCQPALRYAEIYATAGILEATNMDPTGRLSSISIASTARDSWTASLSDTNRRVERHMRGLPQSLHKIAAVETGRGEDRQMRDIDNSFSYWTKLLKRKSPKTLTSEHETRVLPTQPREPCGAI